MAKPLSTLLLLLATSHVVVGNKLGQKTRVLPSKPHPTFVGDCKGCTMMASPSVLQHNLDWVNVKVTGVPYGGPTDWVGVFYPEDISDAGVLLKYPIRWQFANQTCSPRTELLQKKEGLHCVAEACCQYNGYGSNLTASDADVNFQLANTRSDLVFALIQGNPQFPMVIAKSNSVAFALPKEPLQAHLALTGDPSEMRLTWVSGSDLSSPPTVYWGLTPSALTTSVVATGKTYTAADLCGSPASTLGFRDPGTSYTAVMTGLKAETTYYYRFGSGDPTSGFRSGPRFQFVSAPSPDSQVAFSTFGDMGKAMSAFDGSLEHSWDNPPGLGELGSWNTSALLEKQVNRGKTSMVLHIGDISYAVGFSSEWDDFMSQIEPVSARLPWMVGIGNHESDCSCKTNPNPEITWFDGSDSGGECGVPYTTRFPMPAPPAISVPPKATHTQTPWYTFNYGPVAIVVMSTEDDFTQGSAQLTAIETMLKGVDRTVTPWVVFGGHRPMYVSSPQVEPASDPLMKNVEPLLLKYNVSVALWGHHHSYQRSCPMIQGICTPYGTGGIVHAVIGAAGYEFSSLATEDPDWLNFGEDVYFGFGKITANKTFFQFDFLRSDYDEVVDSFYLK